MKIYCLLSTDTFEDNCNVMGKLFPDRDSAIAAMAGQYARMLESLCMEEGGNGSDHYCNREQASARIVDDTSIYTWGVKEFEHDIRIAVEVKDGLVQNIYANAGVSAEVYDLDLTDVEEEGGPAEHGERRVAYVLRFELFELGNGHIFDELLQNRLVRTQKLVRSEPFISGLSESEVRPFGTDVLKYGSKYYLLSDQRIPYCRDKTEDDRFFILTLLGIAKEIEATGAYTSGVIRVQLAVGLPPAQW